MHSQTIERKAFMRRIFKAWEICAFHLDKIRVADDPERALWAVLRVYESSRFERFMLWGEVVSVAKIKYEYEFESIREI